MRTHPPVASIRSWSIGDKAQLDSLLSTDVDPVWLEQFHRLHGPDREGDTWRRTRVAVDDRDEMIGCASIVYNPLHPARLPCAIEVAPRWRRHGIGTALLEMVKGLRPNASRPLSTKVRACDTAVLAFITGRGGRVYQRCPAAVIDAQNPSVQQWARAHSTAACTDLTHLSLDQLGAAFSRQYLWTHRSWSPVGDTTALAAAATAEMEDLDRSLSAGVWHGGKLVAVVFAFRSTSYIDVVAETLAEAEPHGERWLAQAIAFMLRTVRQQPDSHLVAVDGHITDPHLQPVLDSIPALTTNPLHLVEIP